MFLIFTSEPRRGEIVDIGRARLTIGRVRENDLQLTDEKVSRHHAVIEVEQDGRVTLRDLDSRNGTFVDDLRLSGSHVLAPGERLRFGDAHLRVESATPAPTATAAQTPADPGAPSSPRAGIGARVMARIRARRALSAIAVAIVAIAVFGVGQLVLPGLAEQRLRSELARYGPVRAVHVESAPAIKLLWHRADSVRVVMDSYHSEPSGHGSLADFLSRTRDTGKLDVSVGTLQAQLVTLHEVRLRKEGSLLLGQARITQQDLGAALPAYVDLRPVSASQNGIVLQVSATILGHRVAARLRVLADAGHVIVRPEGFPFGSLATIAVFDDPRIYVESLGAELRGNDYLLAVRARLR